jgi:hypothetical protein
MIRYRRRHSKMAFKTEKTQQYYETWRAKNPYSTAVKGQNAKARKKGVEGSFTEQEWLDLLDSHDHPSQP